MMLTIEGMYEMLSRLQRLPQDWDGEGSPKITPEAVASCKRVIGNFEDLSNQPIKIGQPPIKYPIFLYPATGGGLSLWMDNTGQNVIKILPDGAVVIVTMEYSIPKKEGK